MMRKKGFLIHQKRAEIVLSPGIFLELKGFRRGRHAD